MPVVRFVTSFETIVLEEEGKKAVSDWLSAIEHRTVNYDMHRRTMTVRFRYDADAALFKLHWSRQIRT
jgi:CRISPR/Cas system CMR-associated protein Cmr5 small subunit